MSEQYGEWKRCVICKHESHVRRHWSRGLAVENLPRSADAEPEAVMKIEACHVFICRACDELAAAGTLELLEERAYQGWCRGVLEPDGAGLIEFPMEDSEENREWLRRSASHHLAGLLESLAPPLGTVQPLSRQQRRALDRQARKASRKVEARAGLQSMMSDPGGPDAIVTDMIPEELPDRIRVVTDLRGDWVPPEGKGWRKDSETHSPDGKERAILWVRDGD